MLNLSAWLLIVLVLGGMAMTLVGLVWFELGGFNEKEARPDIGFKVMLIGLAMLFAGLSLAFAVK